MCDEWEKDYIAFYNWAMDLWKPGLQIDKDILCDQLDIHPKVYSPETCQFVTPRENVMAQDQVIISDEKAKYITQYMETHPNTTQTRQEIIQELGLSMGQLRRFLSTPRGKVQGNGRGKAGVLTQEHKEYIVAARERRVPYTQIGKELGINWSTCRSYIRKFKKNGNQHV